MDFNTGYAGTLQKKNSCQRWRKSGILMISNVSEVVSGTHRNKGQKM